MALRIKGLQQHIGKLAGEGARLLANVRFEVALLCLLLLTASALIWQDQILLRTTRLTPVNTAGNSHLVFSDSDTDGHTIMRDGGPLSWACDLRAGNPYP
ncbi:MAG TPA: hypothetical protein VLZ84_12520, partial [Asticcacaulis sp.]|nr:hypothetical protein [Asticcacaulis sp.]